ncbi:hypothetical protein DFH11DRAFT_1620487 [Phellopilus nigrolimitatus]|nr:hypothetical protein DFH11DRAFT_1620487 [Phellopilus nigrolimitatus]
MSSGALTLTALGSTFGIVVITCLKFHGGALIPSPSTVRSAHAQLTYNIKSAWSSPIGRRIRYEITDSCAFILECISPYALALYACVAEKFREPYHVLLYRFLVALCRIIIAICRTLKSLSPYALASLAYVAGHCREAYHAVRKLLFCCLVVLCRLFIAMCMLCLLPIVYALQVVIWVKNKIRGAYHALSRGLKALCRIIVAICRAPITLDRLRRHNPKETAEFYRQCTWKNLMKLLRIVKVWEPLPYDLIYDIPKSVRINAVFVPREGLVGVRLRFRNCPNHRMCKHGACGVYGPLDSRLEYFPLEKDGSLSLCLLRKKFSIEEMEFLVPGRWDVWHAVNDRLSPVALHHLTQKWGYVNVVEHEDFFCQKRREFRQWLRGSLSYCIVRWICFLTIGFASLGLIPFAGFIMSFVCPHWVAYWASMLLAAVYVIWDFILYCDRMHACRMPVFPPRNARGWLGPTVASDFL